VNFVAHFIAHFVGNIVEPKQRDTRNLTEIALRCLLLERIQGSRWWWRGPNVAVGTRCCAFPKMGTRGSGSLPQLITGNFRQTLGVTTAVRA
jgi:hypothetical protein